MTTLNIKDLFDVRLRKNDVRSNEPPTLIFCFERGQNSDDGTFDTEFLSHFSPKEQDEFFEEFEHFCVSQKYAKSALPAYMSLRPWLWKFAFFSRVGGGNGN
jgi:hypothetical protein